MVTHDFLSWGCSNDANPSKIDMRNITATLGNAFGKDFLNGNLLNFSIGKMFVAVASLSALFAPVTLCIPKGTTGNRGIRRQ